MTTKPDATAICALWVSMLALAFLDMGINTNAIGTFAIFLAMAICFAALEWIYFRAFFAGEAARSRKAHIYLGLTIVSGSLFGILTTLALWASRAGEFDRSHVLLYAAIGVLAVAGLVRALLLKRWGLR